MQNDFYVNFSSKGPFSPKKVIFFQKKKFFFFIFFENFTYKSFFFIGSKNTLGL